MSKSDIFKALLQTVGLPIIAALVPGGPMIAAVVAHGINEAEHIPGASGADKKAHAIALVHDGLAGLNAGLAASGKAPVADPIELEHAVSEGIDAAIEGIKSVQKRTPVA